MTFALSTELLIQIIAAIAASIAAIAGAFIAARLTEEYRDKSERKAEHYIQIKSRVLSPMLTQIDQYYLPILEFKRPNLTWDQKKITRFAAGINDEPTTYELVSCVVSIFSSRFQPQFENQSEVEKLRIENELYEDSRKNHFNKMLEKWETLVTNTNAFNQKCLQLSDEIRQSIAKKLNLPIDDWNNPGQYVTPYCGAAIFNRMAGTNAFHLNIGVQNTGQGQFLRVSLDNVIIQLDPTADAQKIREIIGEEINERRQRFLELKAEAESIRMELVPLRTQIAIQFEKQKLSGKCAYT